MAESNFLGTKTAGKSTKTKECEKQNGREYDEEGEKRRRWRRTGGRITKNEKNRRWTRTGGRITKNEKKTRRANRSGRRRTELKQKE